MTRLGNRSRPRTEGEEFQHVRANRHGHLKLYETRRICPCGACTSASGLTLKFVAHYGDVAETRIKDRTKLFGEHVIAVHRLLKNRIPCGEYLLFTPSVANHWQQASAPADDTITLAETDDKRTMSSVYSFTKDGEASTRVRIDGYLKDSLILKLLFSLLLKRKLTRWFQASSEHLKRHCEELYAAQPASHTRAVKEERQ